MFNINFDTTNKVVHLMGTIKVKDFIKIANTLSSFKGYIVHTDSLDITESNEEVPELLYNYQGGEA